MKKVVGVYSPPPRHWVGDGFPVRSLFSYNGMGEALSPFLLLDHAGPHEFAPTNKPRGVGQHPHRGFETVTIVYDGEVAHRDSTGHGGVIGPGDVQWMTAASGILHEEFHSPAFTEKGGKLEMVQLWVNLPASAKSSAPGYQVIVNADIPVVALPDNAGTARIIAGEFDGHRGPANTKTPMNVWDLRLQQDSELSLNMTGGWSVALVVMHGSITVNGNTSADATRLVVLDREHEGLHITANSDSVVLLLSGEPIDEPVVGYGPFVMNSEQEIQQAVNDFNNGRFGQMQNSA
ncbi:MAG: pirin family protein [Parahaliea sp.]